MCLVLSKPITYILLTSQKLAWVHLSLQFMDQLTEVKKYPNQLDHIATKLENQDSDPGFFVVVLFFSLSLIC